MCPSKNVKIFLPEKLSSYHQNKVMSSLQHFLLHAKSLGLKIFISNLSQDPRGAWGKFETSDFFLQIDTVTSQQTVFSSLLATNTHVERFEGEAS